MNTLGLENLISSLRCHELELTRGETYKKSKNVVMKSKGSSSRAFKVVEHEEEDGLEDTDADVEYVGYDE